MLGFYLRLHRSEQRQSGHRASRYRLAFPDITLGDIVRAQRLMLDSLGVRHLVAVAGQSFGGFQAFQWAISYPDFLEGIVASVTAPKGFGGEASVKALLAELAADPDWNGGWHYDRGGMRDTMTALRIDTLKRYGTREILAASVPDPADREARMREMAERWAREFDPNSLVTLRKAMVRFDAERDLAKIRARVLYVLSRTDVLFPPGWPPTSWPGSALPAWTRRTSRSTATSATWPRAPTARSGPRPSGAFSTASAGEPEVDGAVGQTGPQAPPSGAPRLARLPGADYHPLHQPRCQVPSVSAPPFAPTPWWFGLLLLLLGLLAPAAPGALAADAPAIATAPVIIDGVTLFRVRGVSAFPADERAEVIADRIRAVAADSGIRRAPCGSSLPSAPLTS